MPRRHTPVFPHSAWQAAPVFPQNLENPQRVAWQAAPVFLVAGGTGFSPAAPVFLTALHLNPASAEAHLMLATLVARHEWDWATSEREFQTALRLAPGMAQAHHEYATALLAPAGRFDEAYSEWRRARELDPFSPAIAYGSAWIRLHHRRFIESEQEFRHLLASGAVHESERIGLAFSLLGQLRYRESLSEWEKVEYCQTTPVFTVIRAWILALSGATDQARVLLDNLNELAESHYVPAGFRAAVHFALGKTDDGFALLNRAYARRGAHLQSLKEGFEWDPIRSDPRFISLLSRVWPNA